MEAEGSGGAAGWQQRPGAGDRRRQEEAETEEAEAGEGKGGLHRPGKQRGGKILG